MSLTRIFSAFVAVAAIALAGPAMAISPSGATLFSDYHGKVISGSPISPAPTASGDLIIDVAGIPSLGGHDDPGNTYLTMMVTPGSLVDQIAWDVNLTAFSPSWLSEITMQVTNSAGDGIWLKPGVGSSTVGTEQFTGSGSLVTSGLDFNVGNDGLLLFQFFDSFDDSSVSPDGMWNFGTVTIAGVNPVPEPGTYATMAAGLFAVLALARRRRRNR